MKKIALAAGLIGAVSAGSFALADDVTVIQKDTDTTGSIVIRKPQPRVVVKENPAIVVRERSDPKIIVRESEPDVVIKEKRKKVVIDGEIE